MTLARPIPLAAPVTIAAPPLIRSMRFPPRANVTGPRGRGQSESSWPLNNPIVSPTLKKVGFEHIDEGGGLANFGRIFVSRGLDRVACAGVCRRPLAEKRHGETRGLRGLPLARYRRHGPC